VKRTATKHQRLALWRASGGVCVICGTALDESFEADHRTPWKVTHTTNVHEMQALCGPCNRKKGKEMLRSHQEAFDDLCRQMAGGDTITEIIAAVTPGGGKSLLPVIAAHRLIGAGRADRICWVTPRLSLGVQGERAFMAKDMRGLLGHSLEIRASTNEINPSRDKCGFVTTYNAISEDKARLHVQEFQRHRYILVLDEPHHVVEGGNWHRALQPIYDLAVLRVIMSGSFERSDDQRIAFLPYGPSFGSRTPVDLNDTDTRKVIRYSLEDALAAHAVVPMYFELTDGTAEWVDRKQQSRRIPSLADAGNDTSAALYTAVSSEYAQELLTNAVSHWTAHRAFNPRAKLLVVAASINHAKAYLSYLRDMGVDAALATSDDSDKALVNIERMKGHKKPAVDVLVTVAMAYEGLDVKAITHIACLTHIRARPWIEQMLARATRFDELAGSWNDQAAHIFAPDDELFAECIKAIKAAQAPYVNERGPQRQSSGATDRNRDFVPILPIASNATAVRASGFHEGDVVDATEYEKILGQAKVSGLHGNSVVKLKHFFDGMLRTYQEATPSAEPPIFDANVDDQTCSQREERWRAKIQFYINEVCTQRCSRNDDGIVDKLEQQARIQAMSGDVIRRYGKSRTVMSETELKRVWDERVSWSGFF